MVNSCINENIALIIYKESKVIEICAIFSKSIPFPPDSFRTNPSKTSVVAFPKIFGPTIVKIVLPIANMKTIIKAEI